MWIILSSEYLDISVAWCMADLQWSCVPFASNRRYVITMFMISDSSVFLEYVCIHILLAYMYKLPCSTCIFSLFLLLPHNSWHQLMLFLSLYPTLNKSYIMYVMLCYVRNFTRKEMIMWKSIYISWGHRGSNCFPESVSIYSRCVKYGIVFSAPADSK